MIVIQGEIRFPAGAFDGYRAAMQTMVAATNQEDGCILYAFSQDVSDGDLMRISEVWRDGDALAAHSKSAHMADFNKVMGGAGLLGLDIKAYDSEGPRSLR